MGWTRGASRKAGRADLARVRRALAGDEVAFEELYRSHFHRLYRFALARLAGDQELAEEVVQASLCKAMERLPRFHGEAPLFSWLCTFCRREIAGRRQARLRTVALPEDRERIRTVLERVAWDAGRDAARDRMPDRTAERREVARLVHVALDHLPSHYSRALEGKYLEGLSVREIAQREGLGVKATESVLTRARRAFRDAFEALASGLDSRATATPAPITPRKETP